MIETAPLKQNGSLVSPYIYNLTGDYSFVTKIHWIINFDTNSIMFSNFGDGSALTNGIEILYDGVSLVGGDVVKTNAGFIKFSYNSFVFSDEKNPKTRIIDTQWLLTSFIEGGIEITPDKTIQIYIRDNIAGYASINNFTATFKGYKRISNNNFDIADRYYPNAINNLLLQDLEEGRNYNLYINTSNTLDGGQWINTTAKTETILIKLAFATQNAEIMHLYLYQDNTLLQSKDWFIQVQELESGGNLINNIVILLAAVIVGFVALGLITNRKKRY